VTWKYQPHQNLFYLQGIVKMRLTQQPVILDSQCSGIQQ
jgi:hypothetical protein